jgi:hypothetical protein
MRVRFFSPSFISPPFKSFMFIILGVSA